MSVHLSLSLSEQLQNVPNKDHADSMLQMPEDELILIMYTYK